MWSRFDEERNIDFNSLAWIRDQGNVVIDPLPLSEHDMRHLEELGGAAYVVVTNRDHLRDAVALKEKFGAELIGPAKERETLGAECDRWVGEGDQIVEGLVVYELDGSKTPGELALLLEGGTLITGDLIRAHRGGALMMLPPPKLSDPDAAQESVRRLSKIEGIEAVVVGDGWPIFNGGGLALAVLAAEI